MRLLRHLLIGRVAASCALSALLPALLASSLIQSCSQGADITPSKEGFKGLSPGEKDDDGFDRDGAENFDSDTGNNDDGFDQGKGDDASGEIVYPNLEFKGNGTIYCGDKAPSLVDELKTDLDKDRLLIDVVDATIGDVGKSTDQANQEIRQAIGATVYVKPTADDKKKLGSYNFASYAIFAKEITKQMKGETYVLDKPLPVFPWPASKARYESLREEGSESWTSKVTGGGRTMTVTVRASYVSSSGDEVTIKLQTSIAEDQGYRLYEELPIAREATYTIDTVKKDVRKIKTLHWFNGEHCNNAPSTIDLYYKLCRKTTGSKSESFCP